MEFAGLSNSQPPASNPSNRSIDWPISSPLLLQTGPKTGLQSSSAVIFIDSNVSDYQQLLPSLAIGAEVYQLNANDAIGQITQTLLGRSGIASLQIISHGRSGALQLGADWLSFDNLGSYSTQIQSWSQALTNDGDILLYGCNVAQGIRGQAFIQALGNLTQADIAASTDRTGNATLGGNWALEAQTGEINRDLQIASSQYQGLLAPELISQVNAISDSTGGILAANPQSPQSVSADGRYAVFSSKADNLVDTDANGFEDVFLYDRQLSTLKLISRTATGTSANGVSTAPVISADGNYVAFLSRSTNLLAATSTDIPDTDDIQDIYVFNVLTQAMSRVTNPENPSGSHSDSGSISISDDGRYVAFTSAGTDQTPFRDANSSSDVFVWDRDGVVGRKITPVSANFGASQLGNGQSTKPVISGKNADGDYYIAFVSSSSDLISVDTPIQDVFLYNVKKFTIERISQPATGNANSNSDSPVISRDGSRVAFVSEASNLIAADDNGKRDVFLWTRTAAVPIQLISASPTGASGTNSSPGAIFDLTSSDPIISADGKFIVFASGATNLLATPTTNTQKQLFLRDVDAGKTVLVSQNTAGEIGNNVASNPTIAVNTIAGATQVNVAFTSTATNLAATDTNAQSDVFVRTIANTTTAIGTGTTTLISNATAGVASSGASSTPILSANGQTLLFSSTAGNLTIDKDTNAAADVFFTDTTGTGTKLITKRLPTRPGNSANANSANTTATPTGKNILSDDGQFIVFSSSASDLTTGDTNGLEDVFQRNLQTGATILISGKTGIVSNGLSTRPIVSGNGKFIAFDSSSSNLTATPDTNNFQDVLMWNGEAATPTISPTLTAITAGNGESTVKGISKDGRYVVFVSQASNLVATGDANGAGSDVFLWDRTTGTVRIVSQNGNGASDDAVISADGRFVAFTSSASNLVAGVTDSNTKADVFLFNIATGVVSLLSGSTAIATSDGTSTAPSISDDGQVIAFISDATNLMATLDTNAAADIFVATNGVAGVKLVSVNTGNTAPGALPAGSFQQGSSQPIVSGDGKFVTYTSNAIDLVAAGLDVNGGDSDVFLRDLTLNTTTLISAKPDGKSAAGKSENPAISGDGRFVLFNSTAAGLDPRDPNGTVQDVFLWDKQTQKVRLLSLNQTNNGSGNQASSNPVISRDGSYAAFGTSASNLVAGDFNAAADLVGGAVKPTVSLILTDGVALESTAAPKAGTYQISRSDTTDAVTVKLAIDLTSTASIADFTLTALNGVTPIVITAGTTPGTYEIVIPAGVATVNLTVTPIDDTLTEPIETLLLRLVADPLYAVRNPTTGVAISDQDTDVVNLNDAGEGSLRQAILNANATAGPNTIAFKLPPTTPTIRRIELLTALPDIVDTVTITGLAAADTGDRPIIDGTKITTVANGLTITGDNSQITGLVIQGFQGNGIGITGTGNTIGNNTIQNNGLDGIRIISGTKNKITSNSIATNKGLGINLITDGTTPVITSAEPIGTGATAGTKFTGTFVGLPSTIYQIEFFNTPATSTDVEGQTFLQTLAVTTDATGNAPIVLNLTTPVTGYVTATATDPLGNTSEFSAPRLIGSVIATIAAKTPLVTEGPGVTYSFDITISRLPAANEPITVKYRTVDGTAVSTAGGDYTAIVDGSVTFSSTDPLTKTITVTVLDDTLREPDETFQVELLGTSTNVVLGATKIASGVIKDNDPLPSVAIGPTLLRKPEGNTGDTDYKFDVTLSAASGEVIKVNYATVDGTATVADLDYAAATGTLTFNPGEPLTQSVTVKIKGDTKLELSENFKLVLSQPVNATLDPAKTEATGVLIADDPFLQPVVTLTRENSNPVVEGNGPTATTPNNKVKFIVKLDRPAPEALQVTYATKDGTARRDDLDYVGSQGTISFAPGEESKTIEIEIRGDIKVEEDETFSLELTGATGATIETPQSQSVTITNDDVRPKPTLRLRSLLPDVIAEKTAVTSPFQFVVELSDPIVGKTVTVDYETIDGTAKAGTDYVATTGKLTFIAGETLSQLITVASIDDAVTETTEGFTLRLKAPVEAELDPTLTSVSVSILDDDIPPPPPIPPTPPAVPPTPPAVPPTPPVVPPTPPAVPPTPPVVPPTPPVVPPTPPVVPPTPPVVPPTPPVVPPVPPAPPVLPSIPVAGGRSGNDGELDLLFRNSQTGENVIWGTDRTPSLNRFNLPKLTEAGWRIAGSADFDGDGDPDLVLRNSITGANVLWILQNEQYQSFVPLFTVPEAAWKIEQVADLTGDGSPDLLWRNDRTGETQIWIMSGTTRVGAIGLPAPETGWQIKGLADFNGDRKLDILWRNSRTGENGLWLLDNGNYITNVLLPKITDLALTIGGVADLDGDGSQNIVWLNQQTGEVYNWNLAGTNYVGSAVLGKVPTNWAVQAVRDFNNDGSSDILWRNTTSGENAVWYLQRGQFGIGVFLPSVDPGFRLTGVADFNRDGGLDYVWNNPGTGESFIWTAQAGSNVANARPIAPVPDTSWQVKGTGDFNRDGTKDLFWYNQRTGDTGIWLMRQGNVLQIKALPASPDLAWTVGGVADFDRDGDADILWYNTRTNETAFWEIQDGQYVRAVVGTTPKLPSAGWTVAGITDFDRDGQPDILWRNTRTGDNGIWRMNGFNFGSVYELPNVDLTWDLLATADFTGDRRPDLLWRNNQSGEVVIWRMNGPIYDPKAVSFLPAVVNRQWVFRGTGDFNLDGFQDILWSNTGTGAISLWYVNNARFGAAVYLPTVPDVAWEIKGIDNFGTN